MELLRQLVESEKLTIPDLEAEVRELGFSTESLTPEETNLIFEQLSTKYKNSKPSKKNTGLSTKVATPVSATDTLKSDLRRGLQESRAEL